MKPKTRSFYELAVLEAVARVIDGLDGALDLQALARTASLSPFHFHRVFRGMVGETPLELHRRLRLERAAHALAHGTETVTTIAFAAGYETHESFTRAFGARYACSPSNFRRAARARKPGCASSLDVELRARSGIHFREHGFDAANVRFARGENTMNVTIEEMNEMRVAYVRHIGPYNRISEAFARLGEIAARTNLVGPQTAMLGIYHDDPETTPPDELRSEAALVISRDTTLPKELEERRLPAGRYASTTHCGSYATLGDTWARLMGEWLPDSEQRVAGGVSYEIYRNTPAEVAEADLRTELYVPLVSTPTNG